MTSDPLSESLSAVHWEAPAPPIAGGGNLRSVEQFVGLRVTVLEGNGVDTVLREVVHYFDGDGNRVAVVPHDPSREAVGRGLRTAHPSVGTASREGMGSHETVGDGMRFVPGEGKALRCDQCGEVIGEWHGDTPPDPKVVDLKCYACAAVGEAERITADG